MKLRRILAASAVIALLTGVGVASAASPATGTDGFTKVKQTRVYDSTRIAGDKLLVSGAGQTITIPTSLVPSGAAAVEIQLTAASETSVNGDLDVAPSGTACSSVGTSNLNYVKGVPVTSDTVAQLGTDGRFEVCDHGAAGSLRLIVDVLGYFAPTPVAPIGVTWNSGGQSVATGGSAKTNATALGSFTLNPGTYQLTLNAKATPSAPTGAVQVYPQFYVYAGQALNTTNGFAGDVFNVGAGALESGSFATIDSYYSGSGTITVTGAPETVYVYGFGYDSDTGAGSYTLDSVGVTAVPVQLASADS